MGVVISHHSLRLITLFMTVNCILYNVHHLTYVQHLTVHAHYRGKCPHRDNTYISRISISSLGFASSYPLVLWGSLLPPIMTLLGLSQLES